MDCLSYSVVGEITVFQENYYITQCEGEMSLRNLTRAIFNAGRVVNFVKSKTR